MDGHAAKARPSDVLTLGGELLDGIFYRLLSAHVELLHVLSDRLIERVLRYALHVRPVWGEGDGGQAADDR
jgi:hypothetical protein